METIQYLISLILSSSEEKKLEGRSMFDAMKGQDPDSLALNLAQLKTVLASFRENCAGLLLKLLTDDNLSVPTLSTLESILRIHLNTDRDTHQRNMEAILSVEYLVSHFVSSSEEKKAEGESMFDEMKQQDPNSLALHLAHLVSPSDSCDLYFRENCAYLLEKLLIDDECHIWNNNLSVPTQSTLKSILLIHLNHDECSGYILEKLCYTVSELCNISNNWPQLFDFLHECITSDSNKESFFCVFSSLAPDICKKLFPDMMDLHSLFLKAMNDENLHFHTRGAALCAAINLIQCLSSLNELKRAESLYPAMMKTLDDAFSKDDQNSAQHRLLRYIMLAKNEPRFFRLYIVDVVNTMLEIAENMNLERTTRHLALEFLITLVEAAREKAPGMMKKVPRFTHTYFALLLNLLLDVKDEPSWYSVENCLDCAWVSLNCDVGLDYLRRFSNALGGKTVAHMAIEQLEAYLVSRKWEKRHAALVALLHIAKGCSKVMIKYLDRLVMNMVLPSFNDPHPRVRWAAINSIVQLSIDFSPELQEQYHIQVMRALVAAMDDFEHPRLQAITIVAVRNYFAKCKDPDILLPYIDTVLNKLHVLLQNDSQMAQQAAIDALSSVVYLSMEHFQKYYGFIMPHLKTILVNAKDKSNHMLHSQVLGCISMIGMAVGKEKSKDDVEQLIKVLISTQELPTKDFGSIFHILKAWLRISSCMGKEFLPYMSTIVPLLVKCAQLQWDNITPDESYYSVHKVMFGDEMVYARKSDLLKVKSLVCAMFGRFAQIFEEDFYPWISQATSILVPLLKFYIHIDIKKEACVALYWILRSSKLAKEKGTAQGEKESYFKQLSCNIIHALGDALYTEPDTKLYAHLLYVLNTCLKICGPLLSEDLLPSIVGVMKHVILESSCRREELTELEKSEDFDAEEAELLWEETKTEENVNVYVGHILSSLVEIFKAAFLPFFDELSPYVMPTRGKDKTSAESIASILIFIELVRHCNESALRYYNIYIPFLLETSNKEHPYLRQCALFGLVLCAEHGISIFKPFVGEALPRINKVIMYLHAREPKNELAFDNAISALVKISLFHRETIGSGQIIPTWLNCLPLKGDIAEAKDVHDQLCMMVERSDTELLGPNYEHFPKILSVFAEVLCAGNDLATKETKKRMINVLKNLQKRIPLATWASAWSLLLPQQDMELESVLSPEEDANFSSEQ